MRQKINHYIMFVLMIIFLGGCITSTNPEQTEVTMYPGELKNFSVNVSSYTTSVVWYLDNVQVSSNYQTMYELSVSEADIGSHLLQVATHIQGRFPDYHSWYISVEPMDNNLEVQFKISVDTQAHVDYGFSYPATYKFTLPENMSGIRVFSKWQIDGTWTEIDPKSKDDFFNGISAARFDYETSEAYISIPFKTESDDIYLVFVDESGNTVSGIIFTEITEYYDGRKAVVTTTQDDWNNAGNDDFLTACAKQRQRKIWMTPGIITQAVSSETWDDIQQQVNEGYVEPVSHSRNHLDEIFFCILATDEIGGSLFDIKKKLDLPELNQCDENEYVYAYLEPFGLSCDATRQEIGRNKYLIDRNSEWDVTSWASWDNKNDCYARVGFTKRMGTDSEEDLSVLNAAFDDVYEKGGIYHLSYHPWALDENEWAAYGDPHLDYIKEKNDVWYVSFGHLYLYHYIQERGSVSVSNEQK